MSTMPPEVKEKYDEWINKAKGHTVFFHPSEQKLFYRFVKICVRHNFPIHMEWLEEQLNNDLRPGYREVEREKVLELVDYLVEYDKVVV